MLAPAPVIPTAPAGAKLTDLEIKDAQLIFRSVWERLERDYGRENLRFPKEIILLGGAPGAGKGTNTTFIKQTRGLTCQPIVVSALLDSPEARRLKDNGNMVGDREVVSLLLRELLRPEYRDGAILDGFPRTKVQVECLTLLVDEMHALRREFYQTPLSIYFRQPTIHIMVLFVDEKESISRQLKRGLATRAHNEEVARTGIGEPLKDRATDHDMALAQRRYRVFKEQTWEALQSLKETFHYHFINAQGPIEEVERNILHELEYQSTLSSIPAPWNGSAASPWPVRSSSTPGRSWSNASTRMSSSARSCLPGSPGSSRKRSSPSCSATRSPAWRTSTPRIPSSMTRSPWPCSSMCSPSGATMRWSTSTAWRSPRRWTSARA